MKVGHFDPARTSESIAEKAGVSEKTVRRAAEFAESVDAIADSVGPKSRCAPSCGLAADLAMRHARSCAIVSRVPHETVPVAVIVDVDAEIAPLVEALNRLPGVRTLDSCRGDGDVRAHVYFCGHTARADEPHLTLEAAGTIVEALAGAHAPGLTVSVEYSAEAETALGRLHVPTSSIPLAVQALYLSAGGGRERTRGTSPICPPRSRR